MPDLEWIAPNVSAYTEFNQLHEFIEKEICKALLDGCTDFGVPSSHRITSEWSTHGRVGIRESSSKEYR